MSTKIEWTDETWNPITGCTPISEGCHNCYAKRMANRLRGRYGYPKDEPFRVTFHPDKLEQPLKWSKPRMIFVCSMGDLFHPDVKTEWIQEVFDRIYKYRHHKYLILTKRPERLLNMVETLFRDVYSLSNWTHKTLPEHLYIGVTAENQKRADERIPILLQIPAAVRFVSVEPMLGPVYLIRKHPFNNFLGPQNEGQWLNCVECGHKQNQYGINWVICGAETGPGARRMEDKWAFDLFRQCKAAKVPFFFKKASKGSVLNWVKHEFPATCRVNGGKMNIQKIKKLVREYETQTGIEAQNFRQLEVLTPETVSGALSSDIKWHIDNSDIKWHIDNTYEMVGPLEEAQNYCLE